MIWLNVIPHCIELCVMLCFCIFTPVSGHMRTNQDSCKQQCLLQTFTFPLPSELPVWHRARLDHCRCASHYEPASRSFVNNMLTLTIWQQRRSTSMTLNTYRFRVTSDVRRPTCCQLPTAISQCCRRWCRPITCKDDACVNLRSTRQLAVATSNEYRLNDTSLQWVTSS